MEEIFSYQDEWGTKILVLAKDGQLGIKTLNGELALLGLDKTVELHTALTKHLNETAS